MISNNQPLDLDTKSTGVLQLQIREDLFTLWSIDEVTPQTLYKCRWRILRVEWNVKENALVEPADFMCDCNVGLSVFNALSALALALSTMSLSTMSLSMKALLLWLQRTVICHFPQCSILDQHFLQSAATAAAMWP